MEHSSLCVLRLLPSSSRLLLDATRPLTPTWLPRSSVLRLLCELSVLRFSELESCRSAAALLRWYTGFWKQSGWREEGRGRRAWGAL